MSLKEVLKALSEIASTQKIGCHERNLVFSGGKKKKKDGSTGKLLLTLLHSTLPDPASKSSDDHQIRMAE